jgi:serine/threonine protein kinase
MIIPEIYSLKDGDTVRSDSAAYVVEKTLGEGGFARVFAVKNQASGSRYALKVINLYEQMPEERDFFSKSALHEFKAGSTVASPNVVRSIDRGNLKNNPFIVMEFCGGGSLEDIVKKGKHLTADEITKITLDVLNGLDSLHQNGIIHRDIKPENILFDENFNAKVADFGVAALINFRKTERNWRGQVKDPLFMTPLYCAPEQTDKNKIFGLTRPTMDIFAFGVMMYYVISGGKFPFGEESNIIRYSLNKQNGVLVNGQLGKYRSDLPAELLNVVHGAIKSDPTQRIQGAKDALKLLGISPKFETSTQKNSSEYLLRVMHGEDVGRVYYINNLARNKNLRLLRIGYAGLNQQPLNDIPLTETLTQWISSRHASLEITTEGKWIIRDGQFYEKDGVKAWHRSRNGVQINSVDVSEKGSELRIGDIITIGDVRLRFEAI